MKDHIIKPWFSLSPPLETNKHIAVIGGGISGVMMAHHLNDRGFKVTVFEKNKKLLSGASGNPAAMLDLRLNLGQKHTQEFYLNAYQYALSYYQMLGNNIFEPRIIEKVAHKDELERFQKIAANYPDDIITFEEDRLKFHNSGIVKPEKIRNCLPNKVKQFFNTTVNKISYDGTCWSLSVNDDKFYVDAVILCNSFDINKLKQSSYLNLDKVSGQVTFLKQTIKNQTILNGKGYYIPSVTYQKI